MKQKSRSNPYESRHFSEIGNGGSTMADDDMSYYVRKAHEKGLAEGAAKERARILSILRTRADFENCALSQLSAAEVIDDLVRVISGGTTVQSTANTPSQVRGRPDWEDPL